MSGESFDLGPILLVIVTTALIAFSALAIASVAFRRTHYLFDRVRQRQDGDRANEDREREGIVRLNLLLLVAFLLWLALVVCVVGIRLVMG